MVASRHADDFRIVKSGGEWKLVKVPSVASLCGRFISSERLSDNRNDELRLSESQVVDGVILGVAVPKAERGISATTLCATGDPSARW